MSAPQYDYQRRNTSARHLISLTDFGPQELACLVNRSVEFSNGASNGAKSLQGKIVGIYFRKPSTRTRSSFSAGALKLGAQIIAYEPGDLQLTTGETAEDTGRILSGYLDALVTRTNDAEAEMRAFAGQNRMSVINAMSQEEHPTQAIADLSTMKEYFGHLDNLHVLYLGEGNNSTSALAYAVALTPGMKLTILTPEQYGLEDAMFDKAVSLAEEHGSEIVQYHSMTHLPEPVDVVYTTRWQTMGVPHEDPNWKERFLPYSVTPKLMADVSKAEGQTIFMHDLPAVRGDDVYDEVLDGPQSLAWRQGEHKMFSAMSVLEWCLKQE